MAQINDIRVETTESQISTISPELLGTLQELDSRVMGSNIWSTITYTSGLISSITYYSDVAKTKMTMRRVISRTLGSDLVNYVTGIVTTVYNDEGTVDSVITTVFNRDSSDRIIGCASAFTTTETPC
jgi:hypothetical protein